MTDIVCIGTSYNKTSLDKRECFSVHNDDIPALYTRIEEHGIIEAVYISTCNRAELYIASDDLQDAARKGIALFKKTAADISDDELYVKYSRDAVCHLFSVTSSLDSMVLGETEIANQVKKCYASATTLNMTGPFTHRLFHAAFRCSKRTRTETGIARNPVSIATIVGDLAKKHFPDLSYRSALLIGAGEMGETVLKYLDKCRIGSVTIANRSSSRAEHISTGLSTTVMTVPLDDIKMEGRSADIIICSISSDRFVLTPELCRSFREAGEDKPLVIIDIGVPRNADPACAGVPGVTLYNIDSLKDIAEENRKARMQEAEKARIIIDECADEFCDWRSEQEVIPAIASVTSKVDSIRMEQLEKFRNTALRHLTEEEFNAVKELTEQIMIKTMHNPIMNMKKHHKETSRVSPDESRTNTELFKRLFLK